MKAGRAPAAVAVASVFLLTGSLTSGAASLDYLVDAWDPERGLPDSSVTAIAQTRDGYLWVGTYDGLARFDGLHFVAINTPEVGHSRVQDLYVDDSGTLWINTYRGGLTSYRNGVFRREWPESGDFDSHTVLAAGSADELLFVTKAGEVLRRQGPAGGSHASWRTVTPPGGARLLYGCADNEQRLWMVGREGQLFRFAGGAFEEIPATGALAGQRFLTVAAAQGHIWAGTDKGVSVWDGHQFQPMTPTNGEAAVDVQYILPTRDGGVWVLSDGRWRKAVCRQWVAEAADWRGLLGSASGRIMGMHEDRSGGIWLNHYGNGLFHITPEGQFQRFTRREGLPGERVWAWFQDAEGNLWVGIERGGLVRLRERRFQVIGVREGLPAHAAQTVCEDAEGAMWFGTSGGGLSRWANGRLESFPVGEDPSDNFVFSVFPGTQGLWLSAQAGEDLYLCRQGQLERAPWPAHGVKAIVQDPAGRVWTGTKNGLSWWLPERHRSFGPRDGMTVSAVRALALGPDGSVWCGNDDGTLYRWTAESLKAFRPTDSLAGQPIWSLLMDGEATVWAGTFQGGLLRYKDGAFTRVTTEQGLPSDVICEILDDTHGQLWLGTHQGICRVDKRALTACLEGRARRLDCATYGRLDGLPSLECGGNYQPACWRARDGRLWFATVKGMVSIKPEDVAVNLAAPPVVIEEFRVDGERMPFDGRTVFVSPGRTQFEFRFAALSFVASDKLRFRYQLEGLDKDWVEADTRRVAQYSHLSARDYRFRVRACNSDGQWNESGAMLAFVLEPYFYQTWWFRVLLGTAIVGGVAGAVRGATTRKYRKALAQLEQQHAIERDRARIAKDIHDDLGAGLTQITLLSELARREPEGAHLDHIADSARQMTRAMDEIVWAVDPQHDTLNGLMDYISAYTEDFLRTAGIRCRMDLPAALPAVHVDAECRYHLFLTLKEALNNVVKHAHATEVRLRLRVNPGSLSLVVEDNGQGLPNGRAGEAGQRLLPGHGLANLEKRLADIGGNCRVTSSSGQGTRVEMTVRVESPSPIVARDLSVKTA
jgi:signal transduction histidine kinase/ligand-binding sensor domain-containing protein